MDESQHNAGIYVINPGPPPEQRTLVVFGAGRGGTTMVAGALAKLGVFMGNDLDTTVEDGDIKTIVKRYPKEEWMTQLSPLFAQRNSDFAEWGFKLPRLAREVAALAGVLRNPCFIFIFRDPVAVSVRNIISADMDFAYSLRRTLETYQIFEIFLRTTSLPCLALSYEKALIHPEQTVQSIVKHLGLRPSATALAEAIDYITPSPSAYRNAVGPKS